MKEPLVSIIIPVYNARSHLNSLLDSIFHQHYTNYEIICVDDGSTDDSAVILQKYQSDLRMNIIQQENGGGVICAKCRSKYCKG